MDFREPYDWDCVGRHDVSKNVASADRWKLVSVTNENELCARPHGFEHGIGELEVCHAHFVYEDCTLEQGIVVVDSETLSLERPREQPVYRRGLAFGLFLESFCCFAGRGCTRYLYADRFKVSDDFVTGSCLSGTRATGQNHDVIAENAIDSGALFVCQYDIHG